MDPGKYLNGNFKADCAERAVGEFLMRGQRCRALVSANDEMALGALRAFQAFGLRVPEDVALTGFDNIEASAWSRPALTTVSFDRVELGRLMGASVLELMAFRQAQAKAKPGARLVPRKAARPKAGEGSAAVSVPAHLVLRQSCGLESPIIS
jgi:DNA-binding LacI/PurR family transcriptional regulator